MTHKELIQRHVDYCELNRYAVDGVITTKSLPAIYQQLDARTRVKRISDAYAAHGFIVKQVGLAEEIKVKNDQGKRVTVRHYTDTIN